MVVVPMHVLVHVPLVLDVPIPMHVHVLLVVDVHVQGVQNLIINLQKEKKALETQIEKGRAGRPSNRRTTETTYIHVLLVHVQRDTFDIESLIVYHAIVTGHE
jgi:hypothetical protein